jgi:hypothetical protein
MILVSGARRNRRYELVQIRLVLCAPSVFSVCGGEFGVRHTHHRVTEGAEVAQRNAETRTLLNTTQS